MVTTVGQCRGATGSENENPNGMRLPLSAASGSLQGCMCCAESLAVRAFGIPKCESSLERIEQCETTDSYWR